MKLLEDFAKKANELHVMFQWRRGLDNGYEIAFCFRFASVKYDVCLNIVCFLFTIQILFIDALPVDQENAVWLIKCNARGLLISCNLLDVVASIPLRENTRT